MKIAIRDIEANPYRKIKSYPISEKKIEELIESIEVTGFWDNLVVRKHPDKDGKYQLAYGHHRIEACKRAGIKEVDLPIRKLDNGTMSAMMARENSETWANSAAIDQQTLASAVEAYGNGDFDGTPTAEALATYPKDTPHPHILVADGNVVRPVAQRSSGTNGKIERCFTLRTLAKHLGWAGKNGYDRARSQFMLLQRAKDGQISLQALEGMSADHAVRLSSALNDVAKKAAEKGASASVTRHVMREATKDVQKAVKAGAGRREVRDIVRKSSNLNLKPKKPYAYLEKTCADLAVTVDLMLVVDSDEDDESDSFSKRLIKVLDVIEHLEDNDIRKRLANAFSRLSVRASKISETVRTEKAKPQKQLAAS